MTAESSAFLSAPGYQSLLCKMMPVELIWTKTCHHRIQLKLKKASFPTCCRHRNPLSTHCELTKQHSIASKTHGGTESKSCACIPEQTHNNSSHDTQHGWENVNNNQGDTSSSPEFHHRHCQVSHIMSCKPTKWWNVSIHAEPIPGSFQSVACTEGRALCLPRSSSGFLTLHCS